jgi:hypothetical protein
MIREAPSEPATALARNLRTQLLERHRAEALSLVAQAMGKWREEGFLRYDDRENSCTIRVFSWMLTLLEAKIDNDDPVQIIPIVEGVTPTKDQLAGRANFATAKRPDIVLFLGGNHAVRICVECKRFRGSANAREYTQNGILRFLAGQYVTDAGRGAMIGYVMTRSIGVRVAQVNEQVEKHPSMGAGHRLGAASPIAPIDDVHVSTHSSTGITLTHLFLDMSDVVSNGRGLLKATATTVATSATK